MNSIKIKIVSKAKTVLIILVLVTIALMGSVSKSQAQVESQSQVDLEKDIKSLLLGRMKDLINQISAYLPAVLSLGEHSTAVPFYTYVSGGGSHSSIDYGRCTTVTCEDFHDEALIGEGKQAKTIVGIDGLPLIVHSTGGYNGLYGLAIEKCRDIDCQDIVKTQLEPDSIGVFSPSLAIGSDRLPFVIYIAREFPPVVDDWIVFYKCSDVSCTKGTKTILLNGTAPHTYAGGGIDVAIQPNGYPIFTLTQNDTQLGPQTVVVACNDLSCSQKRVTKIQDSSYVIEKQAIAIGSDDMPVIAYSRLANGGLYFVHCTSQDCSQYNPSVFIDNNGAAPTFVIGNDGLPYISFRGWSQVDDDAYLTKCRNLTCTSFQTRKVYEDPLPVFPYAIKGADGFPLIFLSTYTTHGTLIVLKCEDAICRNNKISSQSGILWSESFMGAN